MLELLTIPLCAAGFAVRGGWMKEPPLKLAIGEQKERVVWALCASAAVYAVAWHHLPQWALWAMPAAWMAGTPFGWWRSLSMGRVPSDGSLRWCIVKHSARGGLYTGFAAALIAAAGLYSLAALLLLAGLLFGPVYAATWQWVRGLEIRSGEWASGAVVAGACVLWGIT